MCGTLAAPGAGALLAGAGASADRPAVDEAWRGEVRALGAEPIASRVPPLTDVVDMAVRGAETTVACAAPTAGDWTAPAPAVASTAGCDPTVARRAPWPW